MAKEKFARNEPPVNRGTIAFADHGRAMDMGAITKHAALNDCFASMSVDEIDKVISVVFLNRCDINEGPAGDNVGLLLRGAK